MKQPKIIWLATVSVVFFVLAFTGYTIATSVTHNTDTQPLTAEQLVIKEKVDQKLEAAWNDIKKTEGIDDKQWVQFNIMDIDSFYKGENPNFPDKDFCQLAARRIESGLSNQPFNTVQAVAFVKKDQTAIIVAYKDQQGYNHAELTKVTKEGLGDTESTIKQGEKPLEIIRD